MKKKILALCLVVVLAVTAVTGATLAYFTDTDAQKNTFTTGNVKIDLWEDFGDNDENGIEHLVPAVGSAQAGTLKNGIEKEVYVTNDGSEDAYVRVHIAIPSILDNAQPDFDASKNVLHFNYDSASVEDGKWNWSKTVDGTTGSNWNSYTTTIDSVSYNVYVVTYETALKKNDTTLDAIHQVYLDSETTNEDITKIKETLGDNWYIYVVAEGAQAEGFADAYEALNTSFGDPATVAGQVTEAEFKAAYEGRTWEDPDDIEIIF